LLLLLVLFLILLFIFNVEVVQHHREGRDLQAEEPGQRLQAVPNPGSAMIVGVARKGIDPAEESSAHNPLNTARNGVSEERCQTLFLVLTCCL